MVIVKPYSKKTPEENDNIPLKIAKITKKPIYIASSPPVVKVKPLEPPKVVKKANKMPKVVKKDKKKHGSYLPFDKPWPSKKQIQNQNLRHPKPLTKPVILDIPG